MDKLSRIDLISIDVLLTEFEDQLLEERRELAFDRIRNLSNTIKDELQRRDSHGSL